MALSNGDIVQNHTAQRHPFEANIAHDDTHSELLNDAGIPNVYVDPETMPASDVGKDLTSQRCLLEAQSADVDEHSAGTLSAWEASVAIANVLTGSSILTLPYAFRKCGWAALPVLLGVCGIMTFTGLGIGRTLAVVQTRFVADSTPVSSRDFPALGRLAWGARGEAFVSVVFMMELWGASQAAMLVVGVNINILTGMPASWAIMAAGALSFVLVNVPMKYLASLSLVSVAAIFGSASALVLSGVVNFANDDVMDELGSFHDNLRVHGILAALGLTLFCFAGHACLPNIYWNMREPSQYSRACVGGFAMACVFYVGVGCAGYFFFGTYMHQVFTSNIAVDLDGEVVPQIAWLRAVAAALITVKALGTLPLFMLPVFGFVESCAGSLVGGDMGGRRHAVRAVVLTVTVVIVIRFQDILSKVSEVIGCVLSTMVSLIFPCVFYCTIGTASIGVRSAMILLCIFGACCGLMGTLDALGVGF